MNRAKELVYYNSPAWLQDAFISAERFVMRGVEYGPDFRRWRARFEATQWWSEDRLRSWQLEQLRRLLLHAYTRVPAYRQLYDRVGVHPADLRTLDDLRHFPTVSKAAMRGNRDRFMAVNARRFKPVQLNTSGTTGTPFQFYSDRSTEAAERAYWWRARSWGGMRFMEPLISLGGKLVVPVRQRKPPFWRYNRAERQLYLSAFHLAPENMDAYIDAVRRSGIRYLKGYPSNLYVFAQHLRARGMHLPMQAVFSGSEPLFGYVRDLVEERFACRVFDWYGVSERVVTSAQCDQHRGYHTHMETCFVEVLRGDEPAQPGEAGEIVATCLSNYAMPFIRYRTGDVTSWSAERCACGRGLHTLDQVQTKWEDIVTTADGRFISPSVLTHPFKPVKGVEKSQIVQEEPTRILLRLVVNAAFDDAQRAVLVHGFQERLGYDTRVEIEVVGDIDREASGKYRWVVSKVPFSFNEQMAALDVDHAIP